MPIDPTRAIGAELPDQIFSWTESDVLLYHLAIGAGGRPGDHVSPQALRYTLDWAAEGTPSPLQVLPSFGIVAPTFHETRPPGLDIPGVEVSLATLLHGSQSIRAHGPIPTSGRATLRSRVADIWDKGTAAVIVSEGTAVDDEGRDLWTVRSSVFARGEGGFGGERGPSATIALPDRQADTESSYAVRPDQGLLYRLCGDRNPLHADPGFAKAAGFPAPILHGLCSYGIVLRELADTLLEGDASRVRSFDARFAGVVYPGETIRVRSWREDERFLVSATITDQGERDGAPVLADAVLTSSD